MKKFLKRLMFVFVMIFGFTSLVACGTTPNDPPPTEQGSGTETGTGAGTGSGSDTGSGSGTTQEQSAEQQAYALLNASAKALTNASTAEYEALSTGEMVMSGEFNTAEFLTKNAAMVEAMGGAESPYVAGMIAQMEPMAEYFSGVVKSKMIEGYKGPTKEGYLERHDYDEDQEEFNIVEAHHTIKEGNNLINYELSQSFGGSKIKKYIGEDWASYAYLNNENSAMSSVGISDLASNETYSSYKNCLFDLMIKSLPMTIDCNVADYSTVTSSITNDNGNYVLKNHVVLNKLPCDQYGLEMELVGTSDMSIYFTANKITKVVLDFDVESLSVIEMEEGDGGATVYIPFDISIESNMEIVVNNYNATSSANAEYLAAFVATGEDEDLDGHPDMEKTQGGYAYNLFGFAAQNNIAEFGEEIEPKTASEFANDVLEDSYNAIKEYYNTENLVWYTDSNCTKVADDELINKTTAPSYVIELYTKIPLKSNYVRINLGIHDGDQFGIGTTLYLELESGEDSVTINIEDIKNNYLFNEAEFNFATNSVIDTVSVDNERLTGDTFKIEGGKECDLTFLFSKISYVENNEIRYRVELVTESEFAKYQNGLNYERYYYEAYATLTNYDPADDSTHTLQYVISDLLEEMGVENVNASAIYVDGTEVASKDEIITREGGSEVILMIVYPDGQE